MSWLGSPQSAASPAVSAENYAFFQTELRRMSGIVLDDNKQYLVEARLSPVAAQLGLAGLNEFAEALRWDRDGLRRKFVEAMTTHETYFFREPRLWDSLREQILPEIIRQRTPVRRLRFWSAAASSGQEAYSLAMLIADSRLDGWDVQIRGTDISTKILEIARQGRYSQSQISRGLPAHYLVRYFERDRLDWVIAERLRAMVRFEQADLRDQPPVAGLYDLVLCRNVLIYFDAMTKRGVAAGLRQSLAPDGYLALGCAENLLGIEEAFEPVAIGQTVLYRAKEKTNG